MNYFLVVVNCLPGRSHGPRGHMMVRAQCQPEARALAPARASCVSFFSFRVLHDDGSSVFPSRPDVVSSCDCMTWRVSPFSILLIFLYACRSDFEERLLFTYES